MLDRLDAMAAFVAICDTGGFAAAARRLRVSPSVVTRRVAGLEERLGLRLLQRTTRSVRVTEAGERFLERARRILAEVEEAELSAQNERADPRGKLVVTAPALFGRMHVAPILSSYLERYRGVSAELLLADRLANLVEEGIDVAIRIGALADSSLIARRLGQTRRLLVAQPAYLESHGGAPRHPSELARFDFIGFEPLLSGMERTLAASDAAATRVAISPRLATNSGDVAIAQAMAGGGITVVYCYQVADAFRSGALVEVLGEYAPLPVPIQAVFPTSRLLSSKVRAFVTAAEEAAAAWPFGRSAAPRAHARTPPREKH